MRYLLTSQPARQTFSERHLPTSQPASQSDQHSDRHSELMPTITLPRGGKGGNKKLKHKILTANFPPLPTPSVFTSVSRSKHFLLSLSANRLQSLHIHQSQVRYKPGEVTGNGKSARDICE
ncbi:hypothetical protein RRG08_010364 [Elysia crispata]|uniref:Uncharacterized protein n=1 Tax=Elysia crispata TaxID=231223 RepID=A0AAE0Z2M2_9GAST|nr:hypothetical protein RRG08_010364 [Elysia crispata]